MGYEEKIFIQKPEVIVDTDSPKLKRELEEVDQKIREKERSNAPELEKELLRKEKDQIIGNFFELPK